MVDTDKLRYRRRRKEEWKKRRRRRKRKSDDVEPVKLCVNVCVCACV